MLSENIKLPFPPNLATSVADKNWVKMYGNVASYQNLNIFFRTTGMMQEKKLFKHFQGPQNDKYDSNSSSACKLFKF